MLSYKSYSLISNKKKRPWYKERKVSTKEEVMSGTPKHYQRLRENYPAVLDAVGHLGKTVRESGPLQEKEIQLIQLAAATAVKTEGGVHSHARRALEAGATSEEVRHTLLVLISTLGYPNVAAALSWVEDVTEES